MKRETQEPTVDEHGSENHPAFGHVRVGRYSVSPPGAVLFDSDVRHGYTVFLRISAARRTRRDLHHDHIMEAGQKIEVEMSMAQWAELVSSFGSSGVPCTVKFDRTAEEIMVPGLEFDSRLALTHREVSEAAAEAVAKVKAARDKYEEKKTVGNLRDLHYAIENLPSNLEFAAKKLTEHAENVVSKARADIEAFAQSAYERRGMELEPGQSPLALGETRDGD